MQRPITAGFLCLLFCLAPLSGCFGEEGDPGVSEGDVTITPATWIGGEFQGITIAAESDLSAFIPYLILNPENGFVQNSTVVDIEAGDSVQLMVLAPPFFYMKSVTKLWQKNMVVGLSLESIQVV